MADYDIDILIVGGGLIGSLLLNALKSTNYRCLLVDKKSLPLTTGISFDTRSIALSTASIRILKSLGLWQQIEKHAAVIDKIHISEQEIFGSTILENKNKEAYGYVVEMPILNEAFYRAIDTRQVLSQAELKSFDKEKNIAKVVINGQEKNIKAKLIVAADGADSKIRNFCNLICKTKEYTNVALVTNIGLARHHNNIAYERFTRFGPIALLPMTNSRASLVWSLPSSAAQEQVEIPDKLFLQNLQQSFGYRMGRFIKVGKRFIYPLQQRIMPRTYTDSIVFIGNAAHTLHPVAGQGFNLGLRDVATLAQCVAHKGLGNDMLENYQKLRQYDQQSIKTFTDGLVNLFTKNIPGLSIARGLGLFALDNSNKFQDFLIKHTCGFGGNIPDLACQIPIACGEVEE